MPVFLVVHQLAKVYYVYYGDLLSKFLRIIQNPTSSRNLIINILVFENCIDEPRKHLKNEIILSQIARI